MTSTTIPTLAQLIRQAARLRRDLRGLMKKFPEDDIELGDRIFVRLPSTARTFQAGTSTAITVARVKRGV